MTSSRRTRRVGWIAALAALAAIWSALWYGAATRLESTIRSQIASLESSGARAACENLGFSGFPVALELNCAAAAYARDIDGVSLQADGLDTRWSLLSPLTVTTVLSAPASAELPNLLPLDLDWTSLVAQIALAIPRPAGIEFSVDDLLATTGPARTELIAVRSGTFSAKRTGPDIDIAGRAFDLRIAAAAPETGAIPPLSMDLAGKIRDGVRHLIADRPSLRGTAVEIAELRLSAGNEATVEASGSLTVDATGNLAGEMAVRVAGQAEMQAMLLAAFPQEENQIRAGFEALAAMQTPPGSGNGMTLRFVDGQAFLGFLPLGFVPALP